MPFQHAAQPEVTFAVAVGRIFGDDAAYDTLQWADADGHRVSGAIGIIAVHQDGDQATWQEADALRHTVLAIQYGEAGDQLTVGQHYSLPNGEQPSRRRLLTHYRIGAAAYDRTRGAWQPKPEAYDHSALWQTSSLADMASGLAALANPASRNPRTDPLAHLQLYRIMHNLWHHDGFNFREPRINYLVSTILADTARVDPIN